MKINDSKHRRLLLRFSLSLCLLVILTLVASCLPLSVVPDPLVANLTECQPYTTNLGHIGQDCSTGPFTYFYWLADSPPPWVFLDEDTGELRACPPPGSAGVYNFSVGVTEMWPGPVPPPCTTASPSAPVTLTVAAAPPPDPLTILPTFVWAWSMETMPFYLPLSATGCSGNYTWSAAGLPPGLMVDPASGEITGVPPAGSAGIYSVIATVADNSYCDASCCLPASRPFILVIDSYADYLDGIDYSSSYDFTVEIGSGLTEGTTPVMIDGTVETALGGSQSELFTSSVGQNHLVDVQQSVAASDPSIRYSVLGPHQVLVSESDPVARFDYALEVYIETAVEPSGVVQPPGTGYYAMDGIFTSCAGSPLLSETQAGTKYIFNQWRLPDGSTNNNRDLVFTVNGAGTVKAKYDTYYLLTLKSDYPAVNESSWELKDSNATYDLSTQPVPMDGFLGLIGGKMSPSNSSGTVLMDGPKTKEIIWTRNYTIPVVIFVLLLLFIGLVIFVILFFKRRRAHG
jgi:hypothetical protein